MMFKTSVAAACASLSFATRSRRGFLPISRQDPRLSSAFRDGGAHPGVRATLPFARVRFLIGLAGCRRFDPDLVEVFRVELHLSHIMIQP